MPPSAPFLSNPCGHRGCGKMTTESVARTGPWVARSELRQGGNRLPAATPSPGARTRRRSQKPGSRGGAGSASPRVTPMPRARQPGGDQGALSGTRPGRIPSRSLSGSHFCSQPGSSRRAELTEPPRARGEGRVRSVTVQSRRPFAGDGSSSRPVRGQPGPGAALRPSLLPEPEGGAQARGVGDLVTVAVGAAPHAPQRRCRRSPVAPTLSLGTVWPAVQVTALGEAWLQD